MAPTEIAHLRGVLEVRRSELEDLLSNRDAIAVNSSADLLDKIQHASERDMAIGNFERGSARLQEVRAALRRIQRGTFGTCVNCEEEIRLKRLAAVPWTSLCLVCQEAADSNRTAMTENAISDPLLKTT